jgi:phage-related protein
MPDVFTWSVRTDVQGQGSFAVQEARFGDGYRQTVGDGLNNESQTWPVSLVGREAYIRPVLEFLRARKGAISFYWTPPLGEQGFYLCTAYTINAHGAGVYTLTATFEQTFQP